MSVIQPPVRTVILPQEVADVISAAQEQSFTGSITLHFHLGTVATVEQLFRLSVAKKPHGS